MKNRGRFGTPYTRLAAASCGLTHTVAHMTRLHVSVRRMHLVECQCVQAYSPKALQALEQDTRPYTVTHGQLEHSHTSSHMQLHSCLAYQHTRHSRIPLRGPASVHPASRTSKRHDMGLLFPCHETVACSCLELRHLRVVTKHVSSLDMYKLPTLQPIDAVTLLRCKCAHALLLVGCANADTVFPGLARNYKLPGGDWGGGGLKRNPTANLPGSSSRLIRFLPGQGLEILQTIILHFSLHFFCILVLLFYCNRVLVAFFLWHSGFAFFLLSGVGCIFLHAGFAFLFLHSGFGRIIFAFWFCVVVAFGFWLHFLHFDFVFVCFFGVIPLFAFCGCVLLLGVLASAASGLVSFSFSAFRRSCHLVLARFFCISCVCGDCACVLDPCLMCCSKKLLRYDPV